MTVFFKARVGDVTPCILQIDGLVGALVGGVLPRSLLANYLKDP